jgi:hypothetical protein
MAGCSKPQARAHVPHRVAEHHQPGPAPACRPPRVTRSATKRAWQRSRVLHRRPQALGRGPQHDREPFSVRSRREPRGETGHGRVGTRDAAARRRSQSTRSAGRLRESRRISPTGIPVVRRRRGRGAERKECASLTARMGYPRRCWHCEASVGRCRSWMSGPGSVNEVAATSQAPVGTGSSAVVKHNLSADPGAPSQMARGGERRASAPGRPSPGLGPLRARSGSQPDERPVLGRAQAELGAEHSSPREFSESLAVCSYGYAKPSAPV